MVMTLLQACHHGLTGDCAKLIGEGAVKDQDVHSEDPFTDGCSVLQDKALVDEEDATEDEGDHRSQCQSHSEVGHPVVKGSHSHTVGEDALQAHKQQPGWKRHTSTHIMERFGVINLEVSHHHQTNSIGAARHQSAGVDPTLVAVFNHLGIAQKAHHHHHKGSDIADQAEQAALRRVGATFTNEGDVLDSAAGLGEAWSGHLLCACDIVRPVLHRTNMVIHHSHGIHNPYSCDGEGRQADRQDDPGSHLAGSELALAQAWGERGASSRSCDTMEGDQVRGWWGCGVTNTQGDTQGRT